MTKGPVAKADQRERFRGASAVGRQNVCAIAYAPIELSGADANGTYPEQKSVAGASTPFGGLANLAKELTGAADADAGSAIAGAMSRAAPQTDDGFACWRHARRRGRHG